MAEDEAFFSRKGENYGRGRIQSISPCRREVWSYRVSDRYGGSKDSKPLSL
jgi:hypothetical protein